MFGFVFLTALLLSVSVLSLLELSAAFDTLDHATLLKRLETTFVVSADAFHWFSPYVEGRS